MLADSFHHKIELSMKKTGKVYDFMDFVKVIHNFNSGHVVAKITFALWLFKIYDRNLECSIYKLKRPMLNERGLEYLLYKNNNDNYCPFIKFEF